MIRWSMSFVQISASLCANERTLIQPNILTPLHMRSSNVTITLNLHTFALQVKLQKNKNDLTTHKENLGAKGANERAKEDDPVMVTYKELTISKAISMDGERKLSDLVRRVTLKAGKWAKRLTKRFFFTKWQKWYVEQIQELWNEVYTGNKKRPKNFFRTTQCGELSKHEKNSKGVGTHAMHPIRKLMCSFVKHGWIIPGHPEHLNKDPNMFSHNFVNSLQYLYKQWFPLKGGKKHGLDKDGEHDKAGEHGKAHGKGHHDEECKGDFVECGDKDATIEVLKKLDAIKPKETLSIADVNVGDTIEVRVVPK